MSLDRKTGPLLTPQYVKSFCRSRRKSY